MVWALAVQGKWPRYISDVSITINAHPPNRRHFDIDNILKLPIDSLEYANVLKNDSQIKKLSIEIRPIIKEGRLFICLEPYLCSTQSNSAT